MTKMSRLVVMIASMAVLAVSAAPATAQRDTADPDARIGIRVIDGDAEFYEVATGETWVPRGSNLLRFDRGSAESVISPADWDPSWLEARMQALEDGGYNAIRVFPEMCVGSRDCVGGSGERISDAYLDNLVTYLEMAAGHGLHVMLSNNDLPPDSWYVWTGFGEGESEFITPANVAAHRTYLRDLLQGLVERDAPLDWVWAIEIRNEYHYLTDWLPWTWEEGDFVAANGETYDMASASERARLSSEGLTFWADEMTAVIHDIVPEMLVGIGLLLPSDHIRSLGSDDPRYLIAGDFTRVTDVDFFDIHGATPTVKRARRQWVLPDGNEKPIIVGEFAGDFSTKDVVAKVAARFQAMTCQAGFDGWLTWHWEANAGTPVDAALAPSSNPDPCVAADVEIQQVSFRKPVKASRREARRYGPQFLVDNDPESYWSAAAGGPQWAEIDLQEVVELGTIRLPIGIVTPEGSADIRILARGPGTNGKLRQVHRFKPSHIKAGDVLEHTFVKPVKGIRAVRVLVEDLHDEWVILHDVEIYRAK